MFRWPTACSVEGLGRDVGLWRHHRLPGNRRQPMAAGESGSLVDKSRSFGRAAGPAS